MRNTEKRKVKRSFPRPSANDVMGLEKDTQMSAMQNTISTVGGRVELMAAGKDPKNLVSSIEISSIENQE